METVERIYHSVEKESQNTKQIVKKQNLFVFNDDEAHNNRLMDMINDCKSVIADVNETYLRLFDILSEIYEVDSKDLDDSEREFLLKLVNGLNEINKQSGRFFAELSKEQAFRDGCKNDLMDLRINIRSLRESISDIESRLVNIDEETDQLIDDLLAQF